MRADQLRRRPTSRRRAAARCEVAIRWDAAPREVWNEHHDDDDQFYDPAYGLVASGTAYVGAEVVAVVYGPVCCEREVDAYIEEVLRPELNRRLDLIAGPLQYPVRGGETPTLGTR
jgi:hypothetical protein